MTTEEWFKWKKSLDSNFVIPSKEEQDKYEIEEYKKVEKKKIEEVNESLNFVVYYNHT